jgi:hypothetical protein
MLTRTLLVFLASIPIIFVFLMWRISQHSGATTGRILLLELQEATAMAFIPAALYVIFRLVRHLL